MPNPFSTLDGNEAVAEIAYQLNEIMAIYPITPSSPMSECIDQWATEKRKNLWGTIPSVIEMQSEGGAAGAIHGSLQTGSLTTSFTSSQGLMLMLPNMYKIAGELTPMVLQVAARSLAAQALSIFGDHSDVMAARATGYAMLASASVQEAMDFALIAQAATLESRIPFIHFFDGFRTSHEIAKIQTLAAKELSSMISDEAIFNFRARALSPDHPVLRGTTQNPDVYFQARESVNRFYEAVPEIVEQKMKKFKELTGRAYQLYEYVGDPKAERVIVIMASGAETAEETARFLNAKGDRTGVLKVRLFRPWVAARFLGGMPMTVKSIAVLDRTKEPGCLGEPLYQDVVSSFHEDQMSSKPLFPKVPKIIGGRYGLSSKEFTPSMVKAIFDELNAPTPKNHFTVGINDDVTHTSLSYDPKFSIETGEIFGSLFYGLGSDGTVGANKNTIKIIGKNTPKYVQGYFEYDSKKSGAVTISHLRFSSKPIRAPYLVREAHFVGCHQGVFVDRYSDMLDGLVPGGVFLLNTHHSAEKVWDHLPESYQKQIIDKKIKFYVIDAVHVAKSCGLGQRINTIMQVCFFAISGILPKDEALGHIKSSIQTSYGKKGYEIVDRNLKAVDRTLELLFEVKVPAKFTARSHAPKQTLSEVPEIFNRVLNPIIACQGNQLPVSVFPPDGTFPTATAQWEKRNLAEQIPVWEPEICIECGKCAMVCPHASIRIKAYDQTTLTKAPATFKSWEAKEPSWKGMKYTIQVAPEDCTGCGICVDICPAKSKSQTQVKAINMREKDPILEAEKTNWDFFLSIPEMNRQSIQPGSIRQQQVQQPLFEFSGACSGCGETPYLKLLSQLFGDRMLVANATGCSSIYGGNLPTTPWAKNAEGRGPAWSNSLFEDNAEFGLGFRVSVDKQKEFAEELLKDLAQEVGTDLVQPILEAQQIDEPAIFEQRKRVEVLKSKLSKSTSPKAKLLSSVADALVKRSVWIVGGDGWAYDIGFGGLDHVLASGRNVNILVLDTEVYSNTGGQMSKSTPRGAIAKFAAGGKAMGKKDLGLIALTYGHVYVARVAMGARDEQTLKAFLEAEAYDGPSLIIAYSHCIAHGIDMTTAMRHQKNLVDFGQWLLYRFHPERWQQGENPFALDSRTPKQGIENYLMMENRFRMLAQADPEAAKNLFKQAQNDVNMRWRLYEFLSKSNDLFSSQNGAEKTASVVSAAVEREV